MTDLIERVDGQPGGGTKEHEAPAWPPQQQTPSNPHSLGPMQVFVAVLLGSNAVLLMANVSHLSGWRAGAATAIAWIQIGLAVACLARAIRWLVGFVAAASLLGAGLWLSTDKLSTVPHSVMWVGFGLAAAAGVTSLVLIINPATGRYWTSTAVVLTSVIPVGVVAVTTAALLVAPSVPVVDAASVPPSLASTSAALAQKASVVVPGEKSKQFQQILAGNASEQSELKPYVPLDAADQAVLSQELSQSLAAAERFPTVASAKAAGMILAGGMAPGVGAHYQAFSASGLDGQFDPSKPASWIYASTADNAPVVGVMYTSLTAQPPAGFIGPNDHWHQHSNVCIKFAGGKIAVPFATDQDVTPQECSDVQGIFMKKTVWMVHAWVVPGWESPQGVFSHDNLHLYCPGNTDLVDAIGACLRQQ